MRSGSILIGPLVTLLATAVLVTGIHAQDTPAFRISPEDSLDLLRAARSDQGAFERLRRNRLPETWSSGGGRCDERIGRFCLTFSSGRESWAPPPEDEDVVAARDRLIDALGGAVGLVPGDAWMVGQRVRYLVEARRFEGAVAASAGCRAADWWCAALAGFSHHYAAQPLEADSAFDIALAAMDDEQRERWTDLTMILDHRSARTYRHLSGEDRESFEARFWRLADPLLTRPGNELRSEHFARHVWDALQDRATSPDGLSWGYDLREILIRYGWPSGWERVRSSGIAPPGPRPMVTHYSSAPQYLLPPSHALLDETGTAGVWDVEEPRARTGYNVPLADSVARWISPLSHQVAVFRRPDSALVVAGYALPPDSVSADSKVQAGLAVTPTIEFEEPPAIALAEEAGLTGSLVVSSDARPMLMTLEVIVPEEKRIARARYGIDIAPLHPGLLALSDLLLLRDSDTLPDSLAAAVDLARGSGAVRTGERIGVYWEVYGVSAETTSSLAMSLRLAPRQISVFRRLAQSISLFRQSDPIRLRWEEDVPPGPHIGRSLAISIPEIAPGSYSLELTVEALGREPLVVSRDIDVVGDGN